VTRPARALTLVMSAVALGGCAGHRHEGARPAFPRPLALQLAAESDGVARELAGHDDCAARSAAIHLRQQTIREINAGHVPAAFRETLQSSANDLASRIRCVPPVPAAPRASPAPAPEQHGHGNHGKHKGQGKHNGNDQDEGN
jgi:hypothetical protein